MDIGIGGTSRPKPAANRKTCMSCLCYPLLSPSRTWPEQSQPSDGGSPRRLGALPVPHLPGIIPLQSTRCHWCTHAGGGVGENPAGLLMAPAWASTFLSGLSPGTLKALFFILASMCAWYSGYLLAELVPDVPLSSAADSIQSIGGRLVLTGQYRGSS